MRTPELPDSIIKEETKIITLVCYLLEKLGGLTESQLLEIVTINRTVSQFKLSDALAVMESKNLAVLSDKVFRITDDGKLWLNGFENSLAIALRRKMLGIGKDIVRLSSLEKAIKWSVSRIEDGSWVFYACFLNEMDGKPVMEVKIHSKTESGAIKARENFLKDPALALSESIKFFI